MYSLYNLLGFILVSSYNSSKIYDKLNDIFKQTNPWRHPGSAPVWSPCGVAGGNPNGCPEGEGAPGDDCPGGGFAYGPAAENVAFEVTKPVFRSFFICFLFYCVGCSNHRVAEGRSCRSWVGNHCQPWRWLLLQTLPCSTKWRRSGY